MSFNNRSDINFIEYTYDSTFTLKRNEEILQANGSVKTGLVEVLPTTKCGVYVHRAEEFDQRRTVQPLTGDFRIFTYRDLDIRKGDIITINSYGATYEAITGEPIKYETHQEFVCRERGIA